MFRLLLPLIAGILLQWYAPLPPFLLVIVGLLSVITLSAFFYLGLFLRYKLSLYNGIAISLLFISLGALLIYRSDIRNNKDWFMRSYRDSTVLLVTLDEQPVEKTKSVKAESVVNLVFNGNKAAGATGNVILYFQKDSSCYKIGYGTRLLLKKPLQETRDAGNPGGFDYKQYALFHGITHQVYLQPGEYVLLPAKKEKKWKLFIYSLQEKVLAALRGYIKPVKELGLAEALLIGYKDDLDKTLVQSYSNTGVVHIIAISGLHLGLIYWLLFKLFQPLQKRKKIQWLRPLLVITGLWIFTFLAGAQPSVLRSALMFTCIAAAESLSRKTSMYNTLSLSAFILLCYNPFWLWDVGFQLSYAAVISIVIFGRPFYNIFCFNNRIIDQIWKLNSITIAAQLLTLPLCLFYFHQFPNYFLLTNLVAVPLSGIILLGEIFLCIIAFIPWIAIWTGKIVTCLLWLMNTCIEKTEALPFSAWNGLEINLWQAVLLTVFTGLFAWWLIHRSTAMLKLSLVALLFFTAFRSYSFITCSDQQKVVVYNIPQKKAVDFIQGFNACFAGNNSLWQNGYEKRLYLAPSRNLFRASEVQKIPGLLISGSYINFSGMHILWPDHPLTLKKSVIKQPVDLLLISKNAGIFIKEIAASVAAKQVVMDATVPFWQANRIKKECDSLHIPCHDVTIKGAFAINLR